jgi:serine/threonine-protein kinase
MPPSAIDPLIGKVVGGRFRVTGILGEGGMGRVYSGEQQMGTSVRRVAIKTLLAEYARDPDTTARFMREVGTVSELEHPNTIKVYDFGQTDEGELYIAMELLTGVSLEKALEDEHVVLPERADKILAQICGSLAEAHEKGIVHRDLKPANIQLLTRAGEQDYVKVLDFGIAKKEESKQDQKLTRQGTILGTPPYMSPEQFKGAGLDARSDVYSLGIMSYEMLTGRLPFEADTPWQWATQHMTAPPFPFESVPGGAELPAKMKAAIMHALAKEPADRPQTVKDFYDELTLGTVRMSMLAQAPRTSSQVEMPAPARAGGTQVGTPLFTGDPSVATSRTMVDSSGGFSNAPPMHAGPSAVPTAGGQVMTASPGGVPPKKSSMGPIIAIAGVVGVGVIAGAVLMFRGNKSGADVPVIDIPTVATAEVATGADPVASAEPSGVASSAPTVPVATKPTSAPVGPAVPAGATAAEEEACKATMRLAAGNNTALAVNQVQKCKGPSRAAALSAINASANREVAAKKCGGKAGALAAKSVGQGSAMSALPASCR